VDDSSRPSNPYANDVAFWSPSFGGMIILYTMFHLNVEVCCPVLDLWSQLTAILHLSHALSARGEAQVDNDVLPFLETTFEASPSVWAVYP